MVCIICFDVLAHLFYYLTNQIPKKNDVPNHAETVKDERDTEMAMKWMAAQSAPAKLAATPAAVRS